MKLLLDTNVFVWLATGTPTIPVTVLSALTDLNNPIFVSTVSFWELAVKQRIGKALFSSSLTDEIQANMANLSASELTITREHVLETATLPLHHRDPFDALLVAQARVENMTLVTSDVLLTRYDVSVLWRDE